jgi:hypothetical protein
MLTAHGRFIVVPISKTHPTYRTVAGIDQYIDRDYWNDVADSLYELPATTPSEIECREALADAIEAFGRTMYQRWLAGEIPTEALIFTHPKTGEQSWKPVQFPQ